MSQLEDLLQECTAKITLRGGWGTGFFVAPALLLTCAHVVRGVDDSPIEVWWRQMKLQASVEQAIEAHDLALLRVTLPLDVHPLCVYLDAEVRSRDPLYLFGFPDEGDRQGEPRTFNCDGVTGSGGILFNLGQVRPGMSGSALLNQRTGKVCGMVKFTRDRSIDLGGGGISTDVILAQFPQLQELQRQFHESDDRRWSDLVAQLPEAQGMNQTNFGGKNYQTQTGANNTNYIGETHIYNYSSSSPDAGISVRAIDFQPYLESILNHDDYREWQEVYTSTTVEDRKRSRRENLSELTQPKFSSRLKLRAETVKPSESEQQSTGTADRQEQVEQLDVLAGLRKYAPEHVLLIGRPGSGKSTSLERLLWEEADEALRQAANTKIPVLVRLRRCTGTIEALIQDFCRSHQLPLTIAEIETLLDQGKLLLLLDGLNELPEAFRTNVANFRDRYRATTPMIVSTRELSIGGNLNIAKTLKMLPLTESQMQEFVQGYLGQEGNRLFQQLKGDRLRKFAETPLLLWMLCRVFAQNNRVPANLGLAFREFAQLYDTDIQQDAPADSREQWPKLLRHLAFALMHDREPTDFRLSMPREEAADLLTACLQQEGRANARDCAERWLKDLLSYHLIQPVIQPNFEEHVEFRHQLIQEYYAAEYLLRILPMLSDEQLKRDYLNYLKWTEPVALMLAMVEEEAQALQVVKLAMDEVDLMLGARLAGEVEPKFQAITVSWINALEIPPLLSCKCWATSQSQKAIPGLLKAIEDEDFDVRWNAVETLGKLGYVETIPILLKVLEGEDSNVCWNAVEALGNLGNVNAISGLLEALDNQDSYIREKAADALGQLGSDRAIIGLLKTLEDQEPNVRSSAAKALGQLGSDRAVIGLLKALEDQNWDVLWSAAYALEQLSCAEGIARLLKTLEDQNPVVRSNAAIRLGARGSNKVIIGLLTALEDEESDVRWSAAHALGRSGRAEAMPALLKTLEDQESFVRVSATYALGRSGRAEAIPALLKTLEDQDPDVRKTIVEVLGQSGHAEAISALLKTLEDQDPGVRKTTVEVLGQSGHAEAIPALLKILEDQDPGVRVSAAYALGRSGRAEAIPALLKTLEDQDPDVRKTIVEVLGQSGHAEAISGLLKALKDQDSDVRKTTVEVLGQSGHAEAISGLLKALKDQDPDVRKSVAKALGQLGGVEAIPGLLSMLEDQDPNVRDSAAKALGQLGGVEAIPGLLKTLEDQNWNVYKSAAKALGQLRSVEAIPDLVQALCHSDAAIRRIATEALGKIGGEKVAIVLMQVAQTRGVDLREIAIEALGRIAVEDSLTSLTKALIIMTLINALQDKYSIVCRNAVDALGKIGNPKPITELWRQQSTSSKTYTYLAISAIQKHCKYYNHEIAQTILDL